MSLCMYREWGPQRVAYCSLRFVKRAALMVRKGPLLYRAQIIQISVWTDIFCQGRILRVARTVSEYCAYYKRRRSLLSIAATLRSGLCNVLASLRVTFWHLNFVLLEFTLHTQTDRQQRFRSAAQKYVLKTERQIYKNLFRIRQAARWSIWHVLVFKARDRLQVGCRLLHCSSS
jgi:hypothetical protein